MKPIKIRVQSPEHSETIQKMLFALGCHWWCDTQVVQVYSISYLYVYAGGTITHSTDDNGYFDDDFFDRHPHTEVDFDWLMPDTIEVEGRTYDKDEVLARLSTLKPIGEY